MNKIGKKEKIFVVIAGLILLASIVYFCVKKAPELMGPRIYYRTYTKEKGWSKWSKNGKTSGNDKEITAIQIKLKSKKDVKLEYSCLYEDEWSDKTYASNEVCGNKKDQIRSVRINMTSKKELNSKIEYRVNEYKKGWTTWFDNFLPSYTWDDNNKILPIKKIQVRIVDKE